MLKLPLPQLTLDRLDNLNRWITEEQLKAPLTIKPEDATIIFTYRNRETELVENCLKSLRNQTKQDINIIVYDLGSEAKYKKPIEVLCKKYNVKYYYYQTNYFNKSLGLCLATEKATTHYIIYSDIDMIFPSNAIEVILKGLQTSSKPYVNAIIRKLTVSPTSLDTQYLEKNSTPPPHPQSNYGALIGTTKECILKTSGMSTDIPTDGHGQELYVRAMSKGFDEIWISNALTLYHQPHSRNTARAYGREERLKIYDATIEWYKSSIADEKKLGSNHISDGHAKWIHDNKLFMPSSDKRKGISYIVGLRNKDLNLVERSFKSLANQTYHNFEIIIIDWGSDLEYTQNLIKTVKKVLNKHNVKIYRYSVTQWSRSQALNTGIFLASKDYILVSDGDLVFEPEYLERLSGFLNGDTIVSFDDRNLKSLDSNDWFKDSEHDIYGLGLFACAKQSIIDVGGLDERYFGWGIEDNDLFIRLIKNGKEIQPGYPYCFNYHLPHEKFKGGRSRNAQIFNSDKSIDRSEWLESRKVQAIYPDYEIININDNKGDPLENLAIMFVSFLRYNCTQECIKNIRRYYPQVKIYVADQLPPNEKKCKYYETNNVNVFFVPFDFGLPMSRNLLLNHIKEKYVFVIDNDEMIIEKSNLELAIQILERKKDISLVGGIDLLDKDKIKARGFNLKIENNTLYKIPINTEEIEILNCAGINYYYCDMTTNLFIARRKIFDKLKWDTAEKIGAEHTSWFLNFKKLGYKAVSCPQLMLEHKHMDTTEYRKYRSRPVDKKKLYKKWGVTGYVKPTPTTVQASSLYEENISSEDNSNEDIFVTPESMVAYLLIDLLKLSNKLNQNVCLLKLTCLDSTKHNSLKDRESIYIGVNNIGQFMKELQKQGYTVKRKIAIKNGIKIHISTMPNQTKKWKIYEQYCRVPLPLVKYLRDNYGNNWKKDEL